MFRTDENRCFALIVNETSRKVVLKKVKTKEGVLHHKKQSWLIASEPLFYKNQAFYLVTDKKTIAYDIVLDEIEEDETKEAKILKASAFTPSALQKVTTSNFFKALMSSAGWTREDWIKALMFGFGFYQILRWTLLSIFGVSLP